MPHCIRYDNYVTGSQPDVTPLLVEHAKQLRNGTYTLTKKDVKTFWQVNIYISKIWHKNWSLVSCI
jgi:hypothetical protein